MRTPLLFTAALLLGACGPDRAPVEDVSAAQARPSALVLDDGTICRHVEPGATAPVWEGRPVNYSCDARRGIVGTPVVQGDLLRVELARIRDGVVTDSEPILLPLRELQLADGTICRTASDEVPAGGPVRWSCPDGSVLVGDPLLSGGVMTAQRGMDALDVDALEEVPIARAGGRVAG